MSDKYLILTFGGALILTACATAAEPENYAHYSCAELRSQADIAQASVDNIDLFGDNDINELGRTNSRQDDGFNDTHEPRRSTTQTTIKKQRNSIRAAYIQKGCD